MPARKSHSKNRGPPAVIERTQALISDNPISDKKGQSLRKLSIVGVSEPTMRRIAEDTIPSIQIIHY